MSWTVFLPLLGGGFWIGTLLGLLIPWLVEGRPILPSFDPGQTLAFISDLGAFNLKPLFIAGSSLTIFFYVATLLADRALKHHLIRGRTGCGEMTLTAVAILGAALGGTGLILLSIFDNFHFKKTHDMLVVVFIVGNLISASALVLEYLFIVRRHQVPAMDQSMAKKSFIMKLIFLILQFVATVVFVGAEALGHMNLAAVLEFVNAFLFAWFILSFIFDLKGSNKGYQAMPREQPAMHKEQWHGQGMPPMAPGGNGQRYEEMRPFAGRSAV